MHAQDNAKATETTHEVPIAFIGGWGRSGSTLLSRMLGEVEGYVNVGEVRDVFLRGLAENRVCGCGDRFRNCRFWSAVGQLAYGGWDKVNQVRVYDLRRQSDKPWHVPAVLRPSLRRGTHDAAQEYGEILAPLYRAIQEVAAAEVVVDASKIASFGAVLQATPGLAPRFVHLVRDSRGTLNSWMKEVHMTDDPDTTRYMPRYNVGAGAARYVVYNSQMEFLAATGPSIRLRYEDLVADPSLWLGRILDTVGVNADADLESIVGPQGAKLGVSHSVIGNPMRHSSGWIPLRRDDAWRSAMTPMTRRAVTGLTAPVLKRYGYELSASSSGR